MSGIFVVFLQNKNIVKESLIKAEDSLILKLTSYTWIKRYNDNVLLTSINLCVQSEIYERERHAWWRGLFLEGEKRVSFLLRGRRKSPEERKTFLASRRKGDISGFLLLIPRCNKGGHLSPCEWVMTYGYINVSRWDPQGIFSPQHS